MHPQVGDLVPGLRLVEFHRARGDSIDFFQFYSALLDQVRRLAVICGARSHSSSLSNQPSSVAPENSRRSQRFGHLHFGTTQPK